MYIDLSKMNSGFCDRLRQVTFCIAYEQLKNNKFKLIEIYEKKNSECPFYISELINIKNYYIKNVKKKNKNVIKMDPFNSEITLKSCYKYNNRSTIDNYALLKKWKEIYRLIKPKKKIYNKLLKLKRFKKYLSLHIRLTDNRKYSRTNWEDIYHFIKSFSESKFKNKMCDYFKNKTIGYKSGKLKKAFEINN